MHFGHPPPHRMTTLYRGYARSSASVRSRMRVLPPGTYALPDNIHTVADRAKVRQVFAAADRPARRGASRSPCCTQMSTVILTNW